jgi:hypothetical protein
MGNPSGSRADAAYAKALAAFKDGAFDVARRLTLEILAEDPGHAAARALRTRIDSAASAAFPPASRPGQGFGRTTTPQTSGHGPEVSAVDPTVLIERAERRPAEYVEPTVMIQPEPAPWPPRGDVHRAPPTSSRLPQPVSDPTLIPSRKQPPPAPPRSRGGRESSLQLLWLRLTGRGGRAPSSSRQPRSASTSRRPDPGFWTPSTRGAVMVVGGLVVAALVIVGAIGLVRWLWPDGHTLTINKPTGGTIIGDGIECGTRGSACSANPAEGASVKLEAVPDDKYVFTGFKGDCAPVGSLLMTRPRTCGATFEPAAIPAAAAEWPLTITKPTGGTIFVAGGIVCGTLDSACSVKLPDGAPVTVKFEADPGHKFLQFTGDCASNGETTMTTARTCGATFAPTGNAAVVDVTKPIPLPKPRPRPEPVHATPAAPPAAPPPPANTTPANPGSGTVPSAGGGATTGQAPTAPTKPPVAAESEEDHAKREIAQLTKDYCEAYQTLKPQQIKVLFPLVPEKTLENAFKEYRSLKCTVTAPEYDRIDVNGPGGAQIRFNMKHDIVMKSGGAPKTQEFNVTAVVSRISRQAKWLIDRANFELKPK